MKTVAEIDSQGDPVRIFHRTGTAAWTHAPRERYHYRARTRDENGRNVMAWRDMRCDCGVSKSANGRTSVERRCSRPEAAPANPQGLQSGAAA